MQGMQRELDLKNPGSPMPAASMLTSQMEWGWRVQSRAGDTVNMTARMMMPPTTDGARTY